MIANHLNDAEIVKKNTIIKNNTENNKEKGISLISLIVTIVVLLILAGITVRTIIGDNGIIEKGKDAANSLEEMQNSTESAREDLYNEITSERHIQTSDTETSGRFTVDLELNSETENSITAIANAIDSENEIVSYTFYIKKITENDSAYIKIQKEEELLNKVTKSELEGDMGYTVKAVAVDTKGYVGRATKKIIIGNPIRLSVESLKGPDAYPDDLLVQASSAVGSIDYILLPDGTKIEGNSSKFELKTIYSTTKNGPITFVAYDTEGNSRILEYKETNVINFETEWTITEDNTTITLPITGKTDLYIDYGDGTEENVTAKYPTHTYSVAGTYTMKISGMCTFFSYNTSTNKYLTKINKWGCLNNSSYIFQDCKNLTGTIPSPHEKSFINLTTCSFRSCNKLQGDIPADLFKNCSKIEAFNQTFLGCTQLTGIPKGLFDDCKNVTSFQSTFNGCSGLTGNIPTGLFDSCSQVTTFENTFLGCSSLSGAIPTGLFDSCPLVETFAYTFYNCSGLSGAIPTGLFDKCTEVKSFAGTFYYCSGLNGAIPTGLFDSCSQVTTFASTFYNCSGLTGDIPAELFNKCPLVTTFLMTFYKCGDLTGDIPNFSKCSQVTSFAYTFFYCESLTGEIPSGLFDNCEKVITFAGTFAGCSGLTGTIPIGLFDKCPLVKTFAETFAHCGKLTGAIPAGLFDNCEKVTTFAGTFNGCSGLTGVIPDKLFDKCPLVTTFANTFMSCRGLSGSIPAGLFDSCAEKVTTFAGTFGYCRGLTGIPAGLFDNCKEVTSFKATFAGCSGLTGIPTGLFDNCTKVTEFGNNTASDLINTKITTGTFTSCTGLKGNAPDLWNRDNVTASYYCFYNCTGLDNYEEIPDNWK